MIAVEGDVGVLEDAEGAQGDSPASGPPGVARGGTVRRMETPSGRAFANLVARANQSCALGHKCGPDGIASRSMRVLGYDVDIDIDIDYRRIRWGAAGNAELESTMSTQATSAAQISVNRPAPDDSLLITSPARSAGVGSCPRTGTSTSRGSC